MTVNVHVLLLAAGRSSRTGGSHKLLATFDGVPLIRRAAETALASKAQGVTAVLGHRADDLCARLLGLPLSIVYNPDYGLGLSTSLALGFAAAPPEADAVLVMLADQPRLAPTDLDRLIDAFSEKGAGSLVVATDGGEWLNPVVIGRSYAAEVSQITGDKGAKALIHRYANCVREIEIGSAARVDVDTMEAIAAAGGLPEASPN